MVGACRNGVVGDGVRVGVGGVVVVGALLESYLHLILSQRYQESTLT
jgi:hypothetical protein